MIAINEDYWIPKIKSINHADLKIIQTEPRELLSFSITLDCPSRCAHCIVSSGPEAQATTISLETARRYASQMPALSQAGIKRICLTGGEPFVAPQVVSILSQAAVANGMRCGVMTSGNWALDEATAQYIVASHPHIIDWQISTDIFHIAYIPLAQVRLAFLAAKQAGKKTRLRVTCHMPAVEQDRQLVKELREFADLDEIDFQLLRKLGRAKEMETEGNRLLHLPCLTQGILIRWDGSIAPCCVNFTEERQHPFQFGSTTQRPLTAILQDFFCHPLLQLMRTTGFSEIINWLSESGMELSLDNMVFDDICYLCSYIYQNSQVAEYLSRRAAQPENRLKIAVLLSQMYDDNAMLRQTLADLQAEGDQIPGYHQTRLWAEQIGVW
ncbi:MAG: radical SAM protein [Symbiobacteriaceae bacterium]|nr:radical SAM protein [Symbiobacteriaceae bacterium]